MTVPLPSQTVHLMTRLDVRRVLRDMRRSEGRNVRELELYTTDDLRHLYQTKGNDLIRLRDGLVSRANSSPKSSGAAGGTGLGIVCCRQ